MHQPSPPPTCHWPPPQPASDDTCRPIPATVPDHSAPASSPAPRVSIAGYEVLKELGHGSMGVVYKARQKSLDRLVALKTIHLGVQAHPEALSRFISEARAIARLQHPNIVQVYEISLQQDLPFFAMELVEGGNLADYLQGRPQPVRRAASLIHTLALAVHAAHQAGIVHRDLKPANVLLARVGREEASGGRKHPEEVNSEWSHADSGGLRPPLAELVPKIADFGLAKHLEQQSSQTQSGAVLGTPNYMAPEQAGGRSHAVGPAADIYALGAILYEMLTGRPPFNTTSTAETVLLLFQADPVAPSRLQPGVPRDLEVICLECLHKDPRRRYASAAHLAEDLRRFLDGEAIHARPAPLVEQAWRWLRRRPAVAASLACAVALLLSLFSGLVWHQAELRVRLDEARRDERQARAAQEDLRRREQLARRRSEITALLRDARAALAQEDDRAADRSLARARARLDGREADLPELARDLAALEERAAGQRQVRRRLLRFRAAHSQALCHATFSGADLATARAAARTALAAFGVTPGDGKRPEVSSPHLRPAEQREVVAGCYELLLILAESAAHDLSSSGDRPAQARQALALLDHAARLGLATRAYHHRRAGYLDQAGQADEARREQQLAAALPPAGALDDFLQGDEQHRQGNLPAAVAAFERVLQQQAGHFWGRCYLALCWRKQGRPDLAAAALTAALAQRPDFAWLYLQRGAVHSELGDYRAAEADLARAQRCALDEPGRYALLLERGVLLVRQKRAREAAAYLQRAVTLRPQQYQGHANLAEAHRCAGRLNEAVRSLDRAIQCEPRLAGLFRGRARLHLQRGDEPAALADLDQAIRLGSAEPAAVRAADHLQCGRLLLRRGEHESALRASRLAHQLHPDSRARRLEAEALLGLHRHAEALQALDACLARGPVSAELLRARAAVRSRLGQYQGAHADYSRALELSRDADTYAARGWAYLMTATPKLALADFDEALKRKADLADALVGRGLALAQLGQVRRAVESARQALEAGPSSARLSYNAARVYAQAGAQVEDEVRPSRAADLLRREYNRRAVALLEEALRQVPAGQRADFWKSKVLADPRLQPLRRSAEFGSLAAHQADAVR